jgi:hypothetical protein
MTFKRSLLTTLLATSLLGCGSSHRPHPIVTAAAATNRILPPQIVTSKDLADARAGSVGYAVLAWFQAVQFQDSASVRSLTTTAALHGLTDTQLQSMLSLAAPAFPRPRIISALPAGGGVSVRLWMLTYGGSSGTATGAAPFTLRLQRVGRSWRVADISLLRRFAAAVATRARR